MCNIKSSVLTEQYSRAKKKDHLERHCNRFANAATEYALAKLKQRNNGKVLNLKKKNRAFIYCSKGPKFCRELVWLFCFMNS